MQHKNTAEDSCCHQTIVHGCGIGLGLFQAMIADLLPKNDSAFHCKFAGEPTALIGGNHTSHSGDEIQYQTEWTEMN